MIEKTATRVLDGATITRQSGRGRLVVVKGPDRGETIAIAETPVTVGSGGGCDVLLSDPTISRKHLGIEPGPAGLVVRDLGSTNGSFVQGSRFNELTLGFGTEVTIGKTVLKYLPTEEEVDLAPSDQESFGSLVGRDPKLRRLFRVLDDVAATEATVLIEGETGTGKELLAEEIHRHSPRKDGPFIVFDCGAVPDELIESALFGHVRGAFTGAITDRPGAFEEADGGTLFLDEIGELAPGVQPALLRALDKQSVRPVGGSTYTRASVRVVAATNRNLRAEIAARRFREDLYYRVAVVRMSVPPLRERPDDIPLLVQHFMRQFRGDNPLQVTREDLERLRRHDWPGNVRELRNVIERACAVSHGDRLELEDALDERPAASAGWHRTRRRRRPSVQGGEGAHRRGVRARVHPGAARAPQGQPVGGVARCGDRSQAPARAAAQARAARVGRHLTMGAADWLAELRARAARLTREISGGVSGGVTDSADSAVYLRQLIRGNRAKRVFKSIARREARKNAAPTPGQPPVLIIHGYLATRGSLHLLERHLTMRGLIVMSYPLGGLINVGDIRDSAGLIARKVESIVAQTGIARVDIVGHSMGGLVGLDYLKRLGGRHRVRRLVMLGTPAQGTWSALFGLVTAPLGLASLQLLPGSPFLRELAERPLPPGADVVSIGGDPRLAGAALQHRAGRRPTDRAADGTFGPAGRRGGRRGRRRATERTAC